SQTGTAHYANARGRCRSHRAADRELRSSIVKTSNKRAKPCAQLGADLLKLSAASECNVSETARELYEVARHGRGPAATFKKFTYSRVVLRADPSTMLHVTETAARLSCDCNPYRSSTGKLFVVL